MENLMKSQRTVLNQRVSEHRDMGDRLRSVRTKAGDSQCEMARKLSISARSYKSYELGERDIPSSVAVTFCNQFHQDLNWLLTGAEFHTGIDAIQIAEQSFLAVLDINERDHRGLSNVKIVEIAALVRSDVLAMCKPPCEVAEKYFKVLS